MLPDEVDNREKNDETSLQGISQQGLVTSVSVPSAVSRERPQTFRTVAVDDALNAVQPAQTMLLLRTLNMTGGGSTASSSSSTSAEGMRSSSSTAAEGMRRRCLCIATSLPDYSEFVSSKMSLEDWKKWFIAAAAACMRCVIHTAQCVDPGKVETESPIEDSKLNGLEEDEGCCIFYQTDIVVNGAHVSKAYLVMQAAEQVGMPLRWHKIACRVAPGSVGGGGVASFSHVLCFSRSAVFAPPTNRQSQVADVLPDTGDTSWARGTGAATCLMIAQVVADASARAARVPLSSLVLMDPFCGHGSLLAAANAVGMDCIGVELSAKRARKAAKIRLEGLRRSKGGGEGPTFVFEGDRNPSSDQRTVRDSNV